MSPSNVISISCFFLVLVSLVASFIGIKTPLLILNENQVLYLYSTSAQVLAGVYGLTLTGFIFFRNELSREEFEDDTLTEAVESLKSRYFEGVQNSDFCNYSINNYFIAIQCNDCF